jgi:hypothetical protein
VSTPQRKTVSVDFDGVLHTYASGWTGYTPEDGPEPGALEFITALLEDYHVVIVSSRADSEVGRAEIEKWLVKHGFPPLRVSHEKVQAIAYVDDRAVRYDTGSELWEIVRGEIDELADLGRRRNLPSD